MDYDAKIQSIGCRRIALFVNVDFRQSMNSFNFLQMLNQKKVDNGPVIRAEYGC